MISGIIQFFISGIFQVAVFASASFVIICVSVIAQNVFPTGQVSNIYSDWIRDFSSSIVVSSWI